MKTFTKLRLSSSQKAQAMAEQKYLNLFDGADYQYASNAEFMKYQQGVIDKIERYGLDNVVRAFSSLMNKYLLNSQSILPSERAALTQAYVAVQYLPNYPQLVAVFNDTIRAFATKEYSSYAAKVLTSKGIDKSKWLPEVMMMVASQLAMPLTQPRMNILTQVQMYSYIVFVCSEITKQR